MQFIAKGVFLGLTIIAIGYLFLADNNPRPAPAPIVQPAPQLTPEQLAQQEKAQKEAQTNAAKEQEAVRKAAYVARANGIINEIKASEFLLEGAEKDLKQGTLKDIDMFGVGAMLEVIYSTAGKIQEGYDYREYLTQSQISYLKTLEGRLSSFQQGALPKLRLAFKKRTAEAVWASDVRVSFHGAGNTSLLMTGYLFAVNANIQAAEEQIDDLATRLRFKKLIFLPHEYGRGSSYTLKTPSDSTIAAYNGGFQKLKK